MSAGTELPKPKRGDHQTDADGRVWIVLTATAQGVSRVLAGSLAARVMGLE